MEKEETVAATPQESGINDQRLGINDQRLGINDQRSGAALPQEDTIYDLSESSESSENSEDSERSEGSEGSENLEESESSESSEQSESSEISESAEEGKEAELSDAEVQLQKMMNEMGAETMLQIIKDNRNAAIRQIISEVEASRDRSLPSGASTTAKYNSIFDLAALA